MPGSVVGGPCGFFEQIIMTLMRLRLDLGIRDLGYRFGVHESTVSRYFKKWLDVLAVKLADGQTEMSCRKQCLWISERILGSAQL